jgi:hypothetical protein
MREDRMVTTVVVAVTLAWSLPVVLAWQSKTLPGEMVTVTAKVAAVEQQSRTLTLQKPDGTYRTVVVPESFERFPGIKVGDTVTARYYDNIVFRKLAPGEQAVNDAAGAVTPAPGTRPSGTAAVQRTVTTKITAIDRSVPSITFTGPNNWVYSSKVKDPEVLNQVSVGDLVNITWTEALSIEVTAPK